MFALRTVSGLLAMAVLAAIAQPTREGTVPARIEVRDPVRDADTQQRRALLRASLRAQSEVPLARDAPASHGRLLTDRERAHLRQQLRQQ